MSARVSLLGIVWFLALILMFMTPMAEQQEMLSQVVPLRSIVHFFMFWGFSHVWIVTLKKQVKYEKMRSKAILIGILFSLLIALIGESGVQVFGNQPEFQFWNISMDILGGLFGGISFRLLYHSCY